MEKYHTLTANNQDYSIESISDLSYNLETMNYIDVTIKLVDTSKLGEIISLKEPLILTVKNNTEHIDLFVKEMKISDKNLIVNYDNVKFHSLSSQ